MTDRRKAWLRIGIWLLVILWMSLIFCLSSESSTQSGETSGRIIRWLLTQFDKSFLSLSPEEQLLRIGDWSFVVRKIAHLCLFAVLGFLSFAAFSVDFPVWRAFFAALGLSAVRAILDEVHQTFVPGRSCEFRDMCIDIAGAILGAAFLLLILSCLRQRRSRAWEQ